jgi:hypothetical protein
MTLLEVLISIFVLTFALLGMLMLLAVGIRSTVQAKRMDKIAECGQAALGDMRIREWLCEERWDRSVENATEPFIIDPEGISRGLSDTIVIPRISLISVTECEYTSRDFILENSKDGRPQIYREGSPELEVYNKDYTWFVVAQEISEYCHVSIVVCYKRIFEEGSSEVEFLTPIYGRGKLKLSDPPEECPKWVLLVHPQRYAWYKVCSVNGDVIEVEGGDWTHPELVPQLIWFEGVVGVYQQTIANQNFRTESEE